ncbi:peptidoglycan-associated lipoprotein Pal [Erythrobacter sp. LQ02-29]|uniref:peptidoglycan-associated lipoprotein Pal n=1 Tax=unclassified Erythrobacter TaxID=2633097 RepID=UPI001BFC1765|nr:MULTISPECIES: peptidoglycan-associated lipoprotein Pal [unclassified Erythrobacter]MCP9222182.1 peptidoglycan-associated lipoprotein Pal [Erythrobacter sp. LQ02-29]QWC56529.1 peptidoglycan-associated lipoprotein Pal [Erythrobacter sp. 3-20A1M]
MNVRIATAALLIGAASLAGCKSKAPETLPPAGGAVSTPPPAQNTQPTGPAVGTQDHFVNAVRGQNVIYFDTDNYTIDSADAAALQTQAQYLAAYPNLTVTIEGHADERGTRDYNIALGERRANAAKNYLVSLGVSANRIGTVSYGEERPVALGSSPDAWAKNRRAVTVVVN